MTGFCEGFAQVREDSLKPAILIQTGVLHVPFPPLAYLSLSLRRAALRESKQIFAVNLETPVTMASNFVHGLGRSWSCSYSWYSEKNVPSYASGKKKTIAHRLTRKNE